MIKVEIKPELLQWACSRAGYDIEELSERIPQLPVWESGASKPTLKQIERFAKTVHVPVGYLFLQEPPNEKTPIPDFRTAGNHDISSPSPDLLDTIYICQQRQEWYHDFAHSIGETSCPLVGSLDLTTNIETAATQIRHALRFDIEERKKMRTWEEALKQFIEQADELGILVMVNGVVGNNNYRKLDTDEFRGFALCDNLAPLIFINGSDTKSAQMFTLAHELAHILLGKTGLSNSEAVYLPSDQTEVWCNQVAAEILVPLKIMQNEYRKSSDLASEIARLARYFKVSTLVILRRIHDAGYLTKNELWDTYYREIDRLLDIPKGSGGNFYWTQAARVSTRFATALISNTREGQTLHRDAFRLLGFSKLSTFNELGLKLGVA